MVSGRDGTSRDLKMAGAMNISVAIQHGDSQCWKVESYLGKMQQTGCREQTKIKQRYKQNYLQENLDEPTWLGMAEFLAMATVFRVADLLARVCSVLALGFGSRTLWKAEPMVLEREEKHK